jgi:hypothetical protein
MDGHVADVADVADDQYLTVACTERQTTIATYIYMHAKVGLLVMLRRSHASSGSQPSVRSRSRVISASGLPCWS